MLTPPQLEILSKALQQLQAGFQHLPPLPPTEINAVMEAALMTAAERMQDNYPYQHALYLGQMLKPPHPLAQLAYTMAMCINPNNHALDGGRASSALELECVEQIAGMFGWKNALGHLCGGGTMANFEAHWISRELNPGKTCAGSAQAHYTHSRLTAVLQVPYHAVPVDAHGRMDLNRLEDLLKTGTIGTVVATLGTTGLGAVDPLEEIFALREKYEFRLHVDAAYGGYFRLAGNLRPETAKAFAAIEHADSIVIDPHKHGLQPYGCGCVLFRDRRVAAIYHHESPYTYFTSDDLHLGEISLECSRAGAAAVALWTTMKAFPIERGGVFAGNLERGRSAALQLHEWIGRQPRLTPVLNPELDIVVWCVRAETTSESSRLAQRIFQVAADHDLHLALLSLHAELISPLQAVAHFDQPTVACLRATVMKPEHLEWMPEIIRRLEQVTAMVLESGNSDRV